MGEDDPPLRTSERHFTLEQLDEVVANRAVVEQAKGMLMYIYDIGADSAFEMIRSRSRATKTKLRLLAAQLIDDLKLLTPAERLDVQTACNKLLLTVHTRARPSGADRSR
jgi:hypothetical protein